MELRLMVKCCNKDVNNGSNHIELVDAVKPQNQQLQEHVIQWDMFLPLRSLKVLLVEDDDSTRQVVSALLRNCSYEVTAVANGLEAWKVLTDLNKQIDLVLTKVDMRYLSGIGLLSKIMNLVPRKNIPVIMMSSDDSMGIVFNCLSKGAVDFLVKPIRKNELKNLWQHVWRKCHSSSGSESESGVGAHKPTKVRSIEVSDIGTDGSDEDDDRSTYLIAKDGSGTQSCWSKRAVEVESIKHSWDQIAGPPDSTCARVKDKLDVIAMRKDLEIGVPRNSEKNVESNFKETSEPRTKSANNVMVGKLKEALIDKCSPAVELSLKIPLDLEDTDTSTHRRNVLKRYNTPTSNATQAPTTHVGSCSPLDITISSEAAKPVNIQFNDMCSSTNNALGSKSNPPGLCEGDKATQFQICLYHHHDVHNIKQLQQMANQDDGSSKNITSNGLTALAEGNAANYESASGSNNKSNGEKGNSADKGDSYAAITEGSDDVITEKGTIGNLSGSGRGVDHDRLAQREAAFNKFRQKRKERCFEKKVRYRSRKNW